MFTNFRIAFLVLQLDSLCHLFHEGRKQCDKLLPLPGIFLAVSISLNLNTEFSSIVPRPCDNRTTLQNKSLQSLNLGNPSFALEEIFLYLFSIFIDVMGIVRDRQVPCTCETYNGQIGPSSDYSKASSEDEAESTGSNPQQESDLSYSQSNEQSEDTKMTYSQEEKQSHQFESQASYLHNNDTEESQPTDASRRPEEEDGRLMYSQQGGQTNGASEKPAVLISNGHHLSEKDSRNEQQSQNYGTSAGDMNHEDTQRQQFRLSGEQQKTEEDDQSREDEENSIGTDDYPKDSEGSRKFDNGGQNLSLKNDSYPSTQEHIHISEVHRFAAGLPEHYKPHINTDGYNVDKSGEKSVSQDYFNEHANKQSPKVDDTLQGTHGPQGDLFQSATLSHEKVQGSGSQVHPAFTPSASENNYGPFKQPSYPEGYSKGQGELPSDYRVPTKVIAVGKAAENYHTEAQDQDRHGKHISHDT